MTDGAIDNDARRRRVVVAGAGIAGLATALRLHQTGWDVLVVERAPARRSGGYLVNLLGPGYDAAERLGIMPALTAHDLGFFASILVTAQGRRKLTVPVEIAQAALGARAVTVFRGDLESTLYDAVRDVVPIRFGTTVRAVTQEPDGVQITLSDGTPERAELLVGADGVHSGVRQVVFGPESDYRVDLRHLVAAFPLDRDPPDVPERASATFISPRRTAAVINLGPGRSSAFFTYRVADSAAELARGPVPALTAAFGDLGGAVPDALRQLQTDPDIAYFDSVGQIVADSWNHGRVVLLGDSAWCVTLFAGHGASLALAGADTLSAALAAPDSDIPTALAQWEAGLRPEVHKRQSIARKGTSQFAPPSQAHVWARELMLRAIQLPGIRGLVRRSIQRANH